MHLGGGGGGDDGGYFILLFFFLKISFFLSSLRPHRLSYYFARFRSKFSSQVLTYPGLGYPRV
jgi:hypothetical protein